MQIVVTAINSITSKKTNVHWNILHTIDVESGQGKAYFYTDEQYRKLNFDPKNVTNLKSGEIVHLEAQYDNRGNIVNLEA